MNLVGCNFETSLLVPKNQAIDRVNQTNVRTAKCFATQRHPSNRMGSTCHKVDVRLDVGKRLAQTVKGILINPELPPLA
jgi:hypothetical protein